MGSKPVTGPAGAQPNIPKASGEPGVQGFEMVYLALSEGKKPKWKEVLQSFGDVDPAKVTHLTKTHPDRGSLQFDGWKLPNENSVNTFVFVYEDGSNHAAIIYKIPADRAQLPDVAKAIDFSLQSFGLGPGADSARQFYHPPRQ
jgi:hypothetical protein